MTNEERQRSMDFIVDSLASLTVSDQQQNVRLDKLLTTHEKAERRLDRYERILKLMIRAGRRERTRRSEADERLTKALTELAEAHKETERSITHTDSRLDAIIDIVRRRLNGASDDLL